MLNLVENYKDVLDNSEVFHNGMDNSQEIIKKLAFFRHWYYIEEANKFAPSKFIGYKKITFEEYIAGTNREEGYMDGRDTVPRLKKWFKLIPEEENEIYYKKLEEFLSLYDKKPNKKVQLYLKK
ncbi:hypothetical protein [Terrisporobacter petrolearius]|uniref:hypothetical protein n=1 Tax=Terrisporobacter petrolearius TaxID=1460447 RepID=UPI003AFFBA32